MFNNATKALLGSALRKAEEVKSSITGGNGYAEYMYAYLSLKDDIEKILRGEDCD